MISSSPRPLPDNTRHSQQTNIHAPGGIRTHDLCRRAAADLGLRPRGHWDRQLMPVLSLINLLHNVPSNLFKFNFNIIFPCAPWSSRWSLSRRSSHQNPICTPPLPYTCHVLRRPHSPYIHQPNNISDKHKSGSSSLCPFIPSPVISSHLAPSTCHSTLFSNTVSPCSSLNARDQVSHPCKTSKYTRLYFSLHPFHFNRAVPVLCG